jgi:hypothetical protein
MFQRGGMPVVKSCAAVSLSVTADVMSRPRSTNFCAQLRLLTSAATVVAAAMLVGSTVFGQETLTGNYFAHDPSRIIKDGNRYHFFRTDRGINQLVNRFEELDWRRAGVPWCAARLGDECGVRVLSEQLFMGAGCRVFQWQVNASNQLFRLRR